MKSLAVVVALLLASPALAGEKIPVRDALSLAIALRNLDGRMVVVDGKDGQKGTIMQPWEFKSGIVRLRVAENLTILAQVERAAEDARMGIFKQVSQKFGVTEFPPGTAANEAFQQLYEEVLKAPAAGTENLHRIKAGDLKLDVNEIGVTVLSAMAPILDRDVR